MSDKEKLIDVLNHLITILNNDGQFHWSKWMQKAKALLEKSDYEGSKKVLGAYGGMGSFNDMQLNNINRTNENFSSLQSEAWSLAKEINNKCLKELIK